MAGRVRKERMACVLRMAPIAALWASRAVIFCHSKPLKAPFFVISGLRTFFAVFSLLLVLALLLLLLLLLL